MNKQFIFDGIQAIIWNLPSLLNLNPNTNRTWNSELCYFSRRFLAIPLSVKLWEGSRFFFKTFKVFCSSPYQQTWMAIWVFHVLIMWMMTKYWIKQVFKIFVSSSFNLLSFQNPAIISVKNNRFVQLTSMMQLFGNYCHSVTDADTVLANQ